MLLEVFTVFESPVMRERGREGGGREGGEGEVAIPFGGALETSIQHLRTRSGCCTLFLGCELLLVLSHAECA